MEQKASFGARFAAAIAFVLLISTAAMAQDYRGDRISVQGRVTSMQRVGDQYQVTLDHGAYTYFVPVTTIHNRDLRVGDRVRINGFVEGNNVNAQMLAFSNEPNYAVDPNYRGVPFGSSGWMTGTVTSVNRHLGYLWMREDATGESIKVDTRNVSRHLTFGRGEHISVNGSWERRDLFGANRVEW